MIKPTGRSKTLLLPVLLLLAVTLPHLDQGDFRRDTGRYAAVGLYMWTDGSLLTPHLNPETPYFNKPPLALWIHGVFLKFFGVHLAVARVPSVLAALGVVTLSVLTAWRIGSRAEALVSGCVLALTYEFFRRTREISLDFWQLLFVMAAVYLVVVGARSASRGAVMGAGVPLGLALLCKPFVALGMLPILAVWLVLLGRSRWIGWLVAVALPLALLVAAPWHLYMWSQFGDAFAQRYLFHEVVERSRGQLQTGPWYYYGQVLATTYWPWIAVVLFEGWRRWRGGSVRRPSRDLALLGCVWCGLVLLLLSLFPDKKPNYALPVYPMLSWVASAGLCRLPWNRWSDWYRRGLPGLALGAVALLVGLSVAPIQFQKPESAEWRALLGWLRQENVVPGQLRYAELEANEICYFYLRHGHWLREYDAAAREVTEAYPELFLLSGEPLPSAPPGSRIVFQAGKLHVTAVPRGP